MLDDEAGFCAYLCEVATGLGFDAISNDSPQSFIEQYTPGKQVVFVDLYMPGVDGVELLRFMASNSPPEAIVLMSGGDYHVLRAARQLALELELNVIDVIQKPIKKNELELVLKKIPGVLGLADKSGFRRVKPSVNQLQRAIQQKELDLEFQPQYSCATGEMIGVEALARWHSTELGSVSPSIFVPIAESAGLIGDLDRLILDLAIQKFATLKKLKSDLRLSVNMSARTLDDLALPELITTELMRFELEPETLSIEVTETGVMLNLSRSLDILTRLRMKGIRLSIDDFGTGYSSMIQLVQIPFCELKIDKRFVENIEEDKDCHAVVKASISLAKELNLSTVAEGVSNGAILNIVSALGCDFSQGYHHAKPVSTKLLKSAMQRNAKNTLEKTDVV
ncbi:MAG: EAL domain-containing response regulator [Pseudomonadota bacterium]